MVRRAEVIRFDVYRGVLVGRRVAQRQILGSLLEFDPVALQCLLCPQRDRGACSDDEYLEPIALSRKHKRSARTELEEIH